MFKVSLKIWVASQVGGFWHCGTADAHRDVLRIPRARFKIGFILMSALFRIGWLSFRGGECETSEQMTPLRGWSTFCFG